MIKHDACGRTHGGEISKNLISYAVGRLSMHGFRAATFKETVYVARGCWEEGNRGLVVSQESDEK